MTRSLVRDKKQEKRGNTSSFLFSGKGNAADPLKAFFCTTLRI
jgi:hypothetical protein